MTVYEGDKMKRPSEHGGFLKGELKDVFAAIARGKGYEVKKDAETGGYTATNEDEAIAWVRQ